MYSRTRCPHVPHSRRKERTAVRMGVESYERHNNIARTGKEMPASDTPRNLKAMIVDESAGGNRRATKHRHGAEKDREPKFSESWHDGRVRSFTVPNCILQQNEYSTTGSGTSLLQSTPTRSGYRQETCAIYNSSRLLKRISWVLHSGNSFIILEPHTEKKKINTHVLANNSFKYDHLQRVGVQAATPPSRKRVDSAGDDVCRTTVLSAMYHLTRSIIVGSNASDPPVHLALSGISVICKMKCEINEVHRWIRKRTLVGPSSARG